MSTVIDDVTIETRLRDVLAIHFDPKRGSPYWLARAKKLGFDPRAEVKCVADLSRMGTMDPGDMATCALEDFLPRPLWDRRDELMVAQTGGTLGHPVWTAYLENEFREAFVDPFVIAAKHVGFPAGGTWLYVGPSGPHIIDRAAETIARSTGSMAPFRVDFDSRWARKLTTGSFASKRYLQHVVDQALAILESQSITVLFSTPVVVRALADSMDPIQREQIRGVHYGGTAIAPREMEVLQTEAFPNAVHLSGYGNTLFGCCLELGVVAGRELVYYPHGDRVLFGVLDERGEQPSRPMYNRAGAEGSLVFSRLDQTVLLLNVLERDIVRLCDPPRDAPAGFRQMGVASPAPRVEHRHIASVSLY
jgi:hypothetical protein